MNSFLIKKKQLIIINTDEISEGLKGGGEEKVVSLVWKLQQAATWLQQQQQQYLIASLGMITSCGDWLSHSWGAMTAPGHTQTHPGTQPTKLFCWKQLIQFPGGSCSEDNNFSMVSITFISPTCFLFNSLWKTKPKEKNITTSH